MGLAEWQAESERGAVVRAIYGYRMIFSLKRLVPIKFWRNSVERQNEKTRLKAGFSGASKTVEAVSEALYGAGTRRTVCFGETRFFGRLELPGKFGVPQLVTINKSASYGVRWNRTRGFLDVSTLSVCK